MGDSVCNQEFCAAIKVQERVHLAKKFSFLVPLDSSFTTSSDLRLGNDVTTFHRCNICYWKALVDWNTISSISLHNNSVAPIHFQQIFFKIKVKRDFRPIVSGHHKLFAIKFISNNFRISLQLNFFRHYFSFRLMHVEVFLVINKRRWKLKTYSIRKIIVIDHWHYLPNIFCDIQSNYFFRGQILN